MKNMDMNPNSNPDLEKNQVIRISSMVGCACHKFMEENEFNLTQEAKDILSSYVKLGKSLFWDDFSSKDFDDGKLIYRHYLKFLKGNLKPFCVFDFPKFFLQSSIIPSIKNKGFEVFKPLEESYALVEYDFFRVNFYDLDYQSRSEKIRILKSETFKEAKERFLESYKGILDPQMPIEFYGPVHFKMHVRKRKED